MECALILEAAPDSADHSSCKNLCLCSTTCSSVSQMFQKARALLCLRVKCLETCIWNTRCRQFLFLNSLEKTLDPFFLTGIWGPYYGIITVTETTEDKDQE